MASGQNSDGRNIVPGTAPNPDHSLRVKNAEREAIFARIATPLPHGAAERAAAITAKCQDIDAMVAEIAEREKMTREQILSHIKNQSGFTMMHVAAEHGRDEMIDYLYRPGMYIDQPAMRTVMPLARNTTLDRPIHIAARSDGIEFIRALVDKGVSIDSGGVFGSTALHIAVRSRHRQLVANLVGLGANLNMQNMSGQTALHIAVQNVDLDMARFLLDKGADAGIRNAGDLTPGVVAREHPDKSIHLLFIARGLPC
ncbi:uncharacterized protein PG986_002229 [Apiospora aurea]|uniref:Ankyrin repeat protein n=1 Tax=Apiospora aurea TaxID=335848 RepID=A0ABR1QZR2_9PEZI